VPAVEVLRGATPYRDIVPAHGLIEDALFDAAVLRHGPATIGTVLKARTFASWAMSMATYALAVVATGSADVGLLSGFAAAMMTFATGPFRFLPSIVALVLAAAAARRRSLVLFAAAGALTVVAGLTSIDTGVCAFVAILVAAALVAGWREKLRAWSAAAIGAAIILVPAVGAMALAGFAVEFFRVTFVEIPRLTAAYVWPPSLALVGFGDSLPDVLLDLFKTQTFLGFVWIAAVIGLGLRVAARRAPASLAPLVVIAAWTAAMGIDFAERHHLYFYLTAMPLVAGAIVRLRRAGRGAAVAAVGLILVVVIAANPLWHMSTLGALRQAAGRHSMENGWHAVGLPRAHGAYFRDDDIAAIDSVYRYSRTHLRSDETFFDFTDRPLFYFLLERHIPVRQIEAGFYEPAERQREVISRIDRDPRIRFAIVGGKGIDSVPNSDRAPLVWRYVQQHFTPDLQEGSVEIWTRMDQRRATPVARR